MWIIQKDALDLFVELILRDRSVQWKNMLFEYISYPVLPVPHQAAKVSNIWWVILAKKFGFSILSLCFWGSLQDWHVVNAMLTWQNNGF